MKKETYHSSTLGEIPLSFTGRHLLQSLREAIQTALDMKEKAPWQTREYVWRDISVARGKLAQYMSQLERRSERPRAYDSRNEDMTPEQRCCVINSQFGKMPDSHYHLHLPAVPDGYALHIVGNIAAIEPIKEETPPATFGGPEPSESMAEQARRFHNSVHDLKDGSALIAAEKKKQKRERLAAYLNEYRDALFAAYGAPAGNPKLQERIDKARLIIFELMESE